MKLHRLLAVSGLAFVSAIAAQATLITFELTYSGASRANTATATGYITFDDTGLPNPGEYPTKPSTPPDLPPRLLAVTLPDPGSGLPDWLVDLSLTITGASAGNGTFGLGDFGGLIWDTGGATLDLTRELIGQTVGSSTWGASNGGDFNLFGPDFGGVAAIPAIGLADPVDAVAPNGTSAFVLSTNGGKGDAMQLISMKPTVIPEPSTYALLAGLGAFAIAVWRRCRR